MNNETNNFWAGGFLYNPEDKSIFLHHRDGNTKFNPNSWAFFGGLNESGEAPIECFIRELKEEINLLVLTDEVKYLRDYLNVELNTYRYVFYVEKEIGIEHLSLGEGAGFGWVKIKDFYDLEITEKTKLDLEFFIKNILKQKF